MSDECNHDCASCSANCDSRSAESFIAKPHELSHIKKVIGIVSGKGGVGKSLVTSLLATETRKKGISVAVLDADITGPSIPRIFGIKEHAEGDALGVYPAESLSGIKIISSNMLLENETEPVIWRGAMISNMVKQFWTDVVWGDVDIMFIDMPPGTGDVPLTVFQSIKVDGIIIVTSPQELVSMIVQKAVKMAKLMNIPVLGIVENMSFVKCPCCNCEIKIYGEGKTAEVAANYKLDVLARIPVDPALAKACDSGMLEELKTDYMEKAINIITKGSK